MATSRDATSQRWMHTSGGNHYSRRRRIAKRKKAARAWLRQIMGLPA